MMRVLCIEGAAAILQRRQHSPQDCISADDTSGPVTFQLD